MSQPSVGSDREAAVPSFGLLGTSVQRLLLPSDRLKLLRSPGDGVEYSSPPAGQGFAGAGWHRDPHASPALFVLSAEESNLRSARSLAVWRTDLAKELPERCVTGVKSKGARLVGEFARALLTRVDDLHRAEWRLGLVGPDNLYVIPKADSSVLDLFLPDLGFCWTGTLDLTRPVWLSASASDAAWWPDRDPKWQHYCVPSVYRRLHPEFADPAARDAAWNAAKDRDLQLVARLLRYTLTGRPDGPEPSLARRCPIWHAIRAAEAGSFGGSAEAMLTSVQSGLRTASVPADSGGTGTTHGSPAKFILAALALLLIIGCGAAAWWFTRNTPADGTHATTPGSKPSPPPTTLDADSGLNEVDARERDRLVQTVRLELMAAIRTAYSASQNGEHLPLRTLELVTLFERLPPAP
jgi:hypothetical protein